MEAVNTSKVKTAGSLQMKRNIFILFCLALMAVAVFFALQLYLKLDDSEKRNASLLEENKRLLEENKIRVKVLDSTAIAEKIKNMHESSSNPEDSVNNIKKIEQYKTDNENFIKQTDSSAYQKAVQLEKDGFNAIIENKFDVALLKFNEIVAISPSFHSAYEISRMLASNKAKFTDAATQKYLKEQVATKYKWKAPAEKINIIKAQLSNTPAVSTVKPQVTPVTNFTNIKKDTPHNTIKPVYVKPVFVKPQSSTNKLYNHIGGK